MFPRPIVALAILIASALAPEGRADTALLLVNDRYDNAQNLRQGREIEALEAPLQAAGFDVIVARDADGAEMRAALDALLNRGEEGRILIAAMGHFARSASDGWLLGRDAESPSLATVGGDGLSLSVLMEIAAGSPGRAVLLLGEERRRMDLGPGLEPGLGIGTGFFDVPQGVTVLTGAPDDLADFATETLLVPGADLAAALADARRVVAHGFVAAALPFLAEVPAAAEPAAAPPDATSPDAAPVLPSPEEAALWNAATELDTAGAYRAYLDRFPAGVHAEEAAERIAALDADPAALARAGEAAMGLTLTQRQQIQRDLSILDYDTRGIDGILGTGSRTAIQGWQAAQGLDVTGYLDAAQIAALGRQAASRRAELEAAADAARAEEEREDRAFWQVTGQAASEEGLRRYLERYPDGLFADLAAARLDEIEAPRRADAAARDRVAWERARDFDNIAALEGYLADFPGGAFADSARDRIAQLRADANGPDRGTIAAHEAREAALNLPPVTRSLMEQRLAALGLEPGRVDGRFDDQTRRAIRRYQRDRGMPATGYFDEQTVVRLLAETVGQILRLDGVIDR